ncbi:hypothetical protein QE410_001109 [Microbacterium sp. SORGH_AS 1204]|uniref:MoaF C-terminal domain-containing protein n=1 Tax=Microbacterium sp. SORGH_AS_1204 TaxID=3041785 RepID=UPI00279407E9|nr:MoaF C-terminal domain-containing protein [Microbacterium sp. SORGH_AS_1204]MDQ1136310.1 hypothetical protein [Microbacterium sp. SORGH_AS_1204]
MTEVSFDRRDWVALEEMADGFDEYLPESSNALAGRTLHVSLQTDHVAGTGLELHFGTADITVTGPAAEALAATAARPVPYTAVELTTGLFFVHVRLRERAVMSFSWDEVAGSLVGAVGDLGEGDGYHVAQAWFTGVDASRPDAALPRPTTELVGRRMRYRYSSDDVYDHVYVTPDRYTWVCMSGAEAGQCDTEPTRAYHVREGVVLFSWLERVLGVEGMVLIDFAQERTVGIQFAVDQFSGAVIDLLMGAYAAEVSTSPGLDAIDPRPGAV